MGPRFPCGIAISSHHKELIFGHVNGNPYRNNVICGKNHTVKIGQNVHNYASEKKLQHTLKKSCSNCINVTQTRMKWFLSGNRSPDFTLLLLTYLMVHKNWSKVYVVKKFWILIKTGNSQSDGMLQWLPEAHCISINNGGVYL